MPRTEFPKKVRRARAPGRPRNTGNTDPRIADWTGHRFGRWTALKLSADRSTAGRTQWLCRCDCGSEKLVQTCHLVSGNTKSCGCLAAELIGKTRLRHGHTSRGQSSEYMIWSAMKARCNNPSNRSWKYYGAKGVKVCERWAGDFAAFFADMGPRPSSDHSIDRIESSKGYEPDNCRWATAEEQSNNTSRNRIVTVQGEAMTLAQAVKRIGGNYGTVKWRLHRGSSIEEALGIK